MNNHTMHPHPTRRDVTVHMNAMMPIHISNSNGSYTIIFHIIQTIMLTHQLTCINISFSIHISSHPMQAKHMDEFQSNHQSKLFNSTWVVHGQPLIKRRFHLLGTRMHGHFRPHNTQNHFHVFLYKEYPSRRRPLPPGVCRNSTIPVPTHSSCSGGQLCLLSRWDSTNRSRENLEIR